MIRVAGMPLIGHAVSAFRDAGISDVVAVFNPDNVKQCSDYLLSRFGDMNFRIVCRDTATSAETFLALLDLAGKGRIIVSTVDSIYGRGVIDSFVSFSSGMPEDHVCLGMSSYVDDEKPLYIAVDDDGLVTSLGGGVSEFVTCGIYSLDASCSSLYNHMDFPALRRLLSRFVNDGMKVYGFDMGQVIDVDRPGDVEAAERFLEAQCQES
jgi:NDP-sugar pyrophosphorylase family protein